MSYISNRDPWAAHAERVVKTTWGDTVSVEQKGKDLNKFGSNAAIGTSWSTVAQMQGSTANETFVTTNLIDSIVSSSASDTTQTITVEGHTIDGSGNLTFVVQDAALNGQTEVTLTTPLARATRAYVKRSGTFGTTPADLVGNVYIYDNTGGISGGVPVTAAATKLMILAGETRTEKAATATSQIDYWFLTYFSAGVGLAGGPTVDRIILRMEIRDIANGGAWQPMERDLVLIPDQTGILRPLTPYLIVPKNHDWRIRAKTNANTAEIFAEAGGPLALVI